MFHVMRPKLIRLPLAGGIVAASLATVLLAGQAPTFRSRVLTVEVHATVRESDGRLVTVGEDEVEVAHEALLREWPRLRGWLEDDVEGVLVVNVTEGGPAASKDVQPGDVIVEVDQEPVAAPGGKSQRVMRRSASSRWTVGSAGMVQAKLTRRFCNDAPRQASPRQGAS